MFRHLKSFLCNHEYVYAKTEIYSHKTASVYICIKCGKIKKVKIKEAGI